MKKVRTRVRPCADRDKTPEQLTVPHAVSHLGCGAISVDRLDERPSLKHGHDKYADKG